MSRPLHRIAPLATAIGLTVAAACHHSPPPTVAAALPPLPRAQLSEPVPAPPAPSATILAADTAREKHLQIDTHGRDADVRPLLEFVAREGGFTLVYPENFERRVRVSMNDVPVSVALQTLLTLANLTLETTSPGAKRPTTPAVVFYELPVNVDSLSADALMKRFGVGPAIADLIVRSRNRP